MPRKPETVIKRRSRVFLAFFTLVLWMGFEQSLLAKAPAPGFLVSAEEALALEFGLGFKTGRIREYVFVARTYQLSRLDWDFAGLVTLGTALHLRLESWVLGLGFNFGIPGRVGVMQDYDWASVGQDEYGKSYYLMDGLFTNYSWHENVLDGYFSLEFSAYFNLSQGREFWLGLSLEWQHYALWGRDGYLQYPPGSEPIYLSGRLINYTIDQVFPYLGFLLNLGDRNLAASTEIRFSVVGFEHAFDQHFARDLEFLDLFFYLPSVEFRVGLDIRLSKSASWFLRTDLKLCFLTKGDSYMTLTADNTTYRLTSEGGTASWFFGLETGFQFGFSN